jgi:hypothetical protein
MASKLDSVTPICDLRAETCEAWHSGPLPLSKSQKSSSISGRRSIMSKYVSFSHCSQCHAQTYSLVPFHFSARVGQKSKACSSDAVHCRKHNNGP